MQQGTGPGPSAGREKAFVMSEAFIDTRFRTALQRLAKAGRLATHAATADWDLEIASMMKRLDGGVALAFPSVKSYETPIIGNLLCSRENCEAAFDADYNELRRLISRG